MARIPRRVCGQRVPEIAGYDQRIQVWAGNIQLNMVAAFAFLEFSPAMVDHFKVETVAGAILFHRQVLMIFNKGSKAEEGEQVKVAVAVKIGQHGVVDRGNQDPDLSRVIIGFEQVCDQPEL